MWAFARTIPFRSTCGHVSHCVRWPGIWSLSTERELIPAKWPPGDRLHCSCHNRSDRSPALPPACVRATAARHRSAHPHTLSVSHARTNELQRLQERHRSLSARSWTAAAQTSRSLAQRCRSVATRMIRARRPLPKSQIDRCGAPLLSAHTVFFSQLCFSSPSVPRKLLCPETR